METTPKLCGEHGKDSSALEKCHYCYILLTLYWGMSSFNYFAYITVSTFPMYIIHNLLVCAAGLSLRWYECPYCFSMKLRWIDQKTSSIQFYGNHKLQLQCVIHFPTYLCLQYFFTGQKNPPGGCKNISIRMYDFVLTVRKRTQRSLVILYPASQRILSHLSESSHLNMCNCISSLWKEFQDSY